MDNNALHAYFENLAATFVPVSHTPEAPRFTRIDMEELLAQRLDRLDLSAWCLLMETPTGKLQENDGDGYFDNQELAYWIIRDVERGAHAAERETLHQARQYGNAVLAKIRQTLPGLGKVDLSTVEYDKVGPVFGRAYGYRFSFTQPDFAEVRVQAADWNG